MATRDLAIKLNLIEVISSEGKLNSTHRTQPFDFLLVLDFESTCWDKNKETNHPAEIIEFSMVLYEIKTCKIIEQYQQYVMPLEQSKLSEFCIGFTGITQNMVDNGVPLNTCLMLVSKWVTSLMTKHKFTFDRKENKDKCAFVTWSDWDLGNCLKYECKRKNIRKPEIFNQWINIKDLYKQHYKRNPKGLNGALCEVGLKFIGREHSGLDDAKNTAYLIEQMICDGVTLKITKEI